VYSGGLQFGNQVQNEIDWWIFWGRVAGGLNRNQQADIYQRLSGALMPRGGKKQRLNNSLLREMWRTAASLELLPIHTKTELGDAIAKNVKADHFSASDLWCLSRFGARELLYGPINQVIPPITATRWAETLLPVATAGEALASIGRLTGDPMRDLPLATRDAIRTKLAAMPHAESLLAAFEAEDGRDQGALDRMFGEALPSGLVLSSVG
jgi:hypothetical protein